MIKFFARVHDPSRRSYDYRNHIFFREKDFGLSTRHGIGKFRIIRERRSVAPLDAIYAPVRRRSVIGGLLCVGLGERVCALRSHSQARGKENELRGGYRGAMSRKSKCFVVARE